mgnify:FL=1
MTMLLFSEESLSRSGSVSPPGSPDTPPREEKFCPSPTKIPEQKPFRGFDITSLIRKDDDKDGYVSVNVLPSVSILILVLFQVYQVGEKVARVR